MRNTPFERDKFLKCVFYLVCIFNIVLHTRKQITTSWVGCTKFFPQLSLFLHTTDTWHSYWCPWDFCLSIGIFHWFWESPASAYLWQKLFSLQIWSLTVMEANYSVTCLLPALDHVYKPESCSNNSNKQPASYHANSVDFVWCQLSGLLTVSGLEALTAHAQSSSAAFLPCASRDCFGLSLTKAACKQRNGFHSALLRALWSSAPCEWVWLPVARVNGQLSKLGLRTDK